MTDIPVGRGFVVRVEPSTWGRQRRIDVRLWYEYRVGDPDTLRPTKKGIAIPRARVGQLIEALQQVAADPTSAPGRRDTPARATAASS